MSAAITLWNKQMMKSLRNTEEMIGMLIQPVLWVVLFGVGMGSLLGPAMPGGEDFYITFMLPGIIALTASGGAIGGGSVWLMERIRGIVKEYLAAPIPRLSILMGNALSIVTKALLQSIVILVVGVIVGAIDNSIELAPPLIVDRQTIDQVVAVLDRAIASVAKELGYLKSASG